MALPHVSHDDSRKFQKIDLFYFERKKKQKQTRLLIDHFINQKFPLRVAYNN